MSEEFPLYPTLPDAAQKEAQDLLNKFKADIAKAAENAIGELYCDVMPYIESDTWSNFRNELMDGFKNYDNRKIQGEYDFKELRLAIYENHKEEITKDLNQDLLAEIESLKKQIQFMRECERSRY